MHREPERALGHGIDRELKLDRAARVQVALEVQRLPVGDAQVDLCRALAGELDPDRVLLVAAVDRRGPETVDLGDRAPRDWYTPPVGRGPADIHPKIIRRGVTEQVERLGRDGLVGLRHPAPVVPRI